MGGAGVWTYGVVDEVRDNGLHELLVAPVADESDQHLKQLTDQALKVHVVPILICLQHKSKSTPLYTEAAQGCLPAVAKHSQWVKGYQHSEVLQAQVGVLYTESTSKVPSQCTVPGEGP